MAGDSVGVTEDAGVGSGPLAELDELLLEAKLSVPGPSPASVSRAELVETAWASGRRMVGVTAPAGYGKSTLLAQWARAEDRRVAWVSLDRFDDDPAALLTVLACAYARVSPGNAGLVADIRGPGVSVLGWAAPRLTAAPRTIANDSDGDASTVAGDDRYVADYLYRESLIQLPENDRRFLRRTACCAVRRSRGSTGSRPRGLKLLNGHSVRPHGPGDFSTDVPPHSEQAEGARP